MSSMWERNHETTEGFGLNADRTK